MKRTVRARITVVSFAVGLMVSVLVAAVLFAFNVIRPYFELAELNQKALDSIGCTEVPAMAVVGERLLCDVTTIENDPKFKRPDYVLLKDTHYFLFSSATPSQFWLNQSDPAFLELFREPRSVRLPDSYTWRLYSDTRKIDGHRAKFLVGYLEDGPSLPRPVRPTPELDDMLRNAPAELASRLFREGNRLRAAKSLPKVINKLETWEIVDGDTNEVIAWSEDTPARFPRDPGFDLNRRVYWDGSDLYLVRSDSSNTLVAVRLARIGNVWWFGTALFTVFVLASVGVYVLCWKWLRKYFLPGKCATIEEALRTGEGSNIEFKRDAGDRRALFRAIAAAITAFANTEGGTVLVGVGDDRHVEGLRGQGPEEEDRFLQAVWNVIRDTIRPVPMVDVHLEEAKGVTVARICVPRGVDPLYCVGGVVYVRRGAETVPAQPEDIKRLLEQNPC